MQTNNAVITVDEQNIETKGDKFNSIVQRQNRKHNIHTCIHRMPTYLARRTVNGENDCKPEHLESISLKISPLVAYALTITDVRVEISFAVLCLSARK